MMSTRLRECLQGQIGCWSPGRDVCTQSCVVQCTSKSLLPVLVATFVIYRNNSKVGKVSMVSLVVQWFCSHFPVERCAEMELVLCSSTPYLNVSFAYFDICSICSVEQLGNSQCCLMAVGLNLSASFCRYVVS
ncbi:hypothetical protein DAPPUDRAFT_99605 [Daphnia pulex]|uniref:Uncharacterized protein n=1 Tax=Daphnia pulex TaxID=6669 RepID=E9G7E2_DAPPU|nr:hypothetical protein DAPPUDRAFT_99605 [Daphnia pulex]|eukprot:EFX84455.1 hypothetical protein DAPPUDRAFT_99605 [Daphnia pulex]